MHVWFQCSGWTNAFCIRSPIDWQYYSGRACLARLSYSPVPPR